jgi:hypothetical protein
MSRWGVLVGLFLALGCQDEPRLSAKAAVEERRAAATAAMDAIVRVGQLARELDAKAVQAPKGEGIALNFSTSVADVTAGVFDTRQLAAGFNTAEEDPYRFAFVNPTYQSLGEMLAPGFAEPMQRKDVLEAVQRVKHHTAWLAALRYAVIVRELTYVAPKFYDEYDGGKYDAGTNVSLVAIYELPEGKLLGGFELDSGVRVAQIIVTRDFATRKLVDDPIATLKRELAISAYQDLLERLSDHFKVFSEIGHEVKR